MSRRRQKRKRREPRSHQQRIGRGMRTPLVEVFRADAQTLLYLYRLRRLA